MKFEKSWRDSHLEAHDDGSYVFHYKTWGYETFKTKEALKKKVSKWVEDQIENLIKELDAMRKLKNFINKL